MRNIYYLGTLLAILLISLMLGTLKPTNIEGLVNLDSKYLEVKPRPQDESGSPQLPDGYYIVETNFNAASVRPGNVATPDKVGTLLNISDNTNSDAMMAQIPPGYVTTPDMKGIFLDITNSKNSDKIYDIKQDNAGNYTVPNGYYALGSNKMAIIPYGFKLNSSKTGITLDPHTNIINAPIAQNSPTSNLSDASANSLIKYNSNNYNVKYHDDISMNDYLGGVQPKPIYYSPGAFKYGGASYVPNYEDGVYLSKSTFLPKPISYNKNSVHSNAICDKYKYEPEQLENACNSLDSNSCQSSNCCVLFGGQKCVSGNEKGPTMKTEYSDFLIKNRDYYYYKGQCYGNCTN